MSDTVSPFPSTDNPSPQKRWQCNVCGYTASWPKRVLMENALCPCDSLWAPKWRVPSTSGLQRALSHRDVLGFVYSVGNGAELALVYDYQVILQDLWLYEACLLEAWSGGRTSYYRWDREVLESMLLAAKRTVLRQLGDPYPRRKTYTLYRGVAGAEPARRVNGFSWTGSLAKAWWFARRWAWAGLEDPAVYQAEVPARHILAHTNDRNEDEYLVVLPADFPMQRLPEPTKA